MAARRSSKPAASSTSTTSCRRPGPNGRPSGKRWSTRRSRARTVPSFMDCWHETLAVDIAAGYALATGRMQAVLAACRLGPVAGRHGHSRRVAGRRADAGGLGRIDDLRGTARVRSRRAMDQQSEHRRRHDPAGRTHRQIRVAGGKPVYDLRERDPGRRDVAKRAPAGPDLSERLDRDPDGRMDRRRRTAGRSPPRREP